MADYQFYLDRAESSVGIETSKGFTRLARDLGSDYFHRWKINGVALYWAINHLTSAIGALTRSVDALHSRVTKLEDAAKVVPQ